MEITVLCKVVDNFGDVGFVWRLCKQLKNINADFNINLIADDLSAFNKICNSVLPSKNHQTVNKIEIYDWNADDLCYSDFSKNDGQKLSLILECFQCGRPAWLEKILFEDKLQRTVNIIMIDYLTAEKYAEDFHCLKSLTRSAKVQKVNFMPGFTAKTGGLTIDREWAELGKRNAKGPILVFTYERNWGALVRGINHTREKNRTRGGEISGDPAENHTEAENYTRGGDLKVLLAQGRGKKSFETSYHQLKNPKFGLEILPYLNQEDWDKMMKTCSLLFVRGEESMSRACLSGIPFVWHAYPQSEEYQLVKVEALLERMKGHFKDDDFEIIKKVWLDFNRGEGEVPADEFEADCKVFIENADNLEYGFRDFALDLRKNGDLAGNLMTFIGKIDIIK